ncbi:MAG: hypothetical protein HYV51_03380 [Parcubacteria group bacterium]|nr:hypothetical protein [Parcubacteria group bacterium]
MKTLIILAIILAILAAYFVFNTEKSLSLKDRGNAIPAGIDIGKSILNQVLNQAKKITPEKINSISGTNGNGAVMQSKLAEEIKSKIGEIKDKILDEAVNLIKTPIENKANELFCPQK